MKSGTYHAEKEAGIVLIAKRYHHLKQILKAYGSNPNLQVLPFNSGYFMSFACAGNAETLRLYLLDKYEVGTISIQSKYLRLAFSSIDIEQLEDLIAIVYKAAEEVFQASAGQKA
jgi:DNA-binding transcriptional MocR family regulator